MSDQEISKDGVDANMADGRQDHSIGYEDPKTEIMKSSQKRSGEIRTR